MVIADLADVVWPATYLPTYVRGSKKDPRFGDSGLFRALHRLNFVRSIFLDRTVLTQVTAAVHLTYMEVTRQ